MEFIGFPKLTRLNREMIVTEKIDGTNAQVYITETNDNCVDTLVYELARQDGFSMFAGSRTRWITPGKNDNAGFASWVKLNAAELFRLGAGQHFGEWWGKGIQRGYGLEERRFSLFNAERWSDASVRPACCDVVPTLYKGIFKTETINDIIDALNQEGSIVVPGYMKPEGVVIWHTALNRAFKVTCERDESRKSEVK